MPSPEEESKSLVRDEYERLVAQSDFFGWDLRLLDAGDYCVIFARVVKDAERTFVFRLICDDFPEVAPQQAFIDAALFEEADEETEAKAEFWPAGDYVDTGRSPLPVLCIKGHRDYYRDGWHEGWTVPPAHDHSIYQHVVNLRNALLDTWH